MLPRQDLAPNIVDDTIQVWLGDPTAERLDRVPSHCDFWRADRSGFLYLQRGFDEDALDQVAPGSALGIPLPIWREVVSLREDDFNLIERHRSEDGIQRKISDRRYSQA